MKTKLHAFLPLANRITVIATVSISLIANSQIVYTDVDPDYSGANIGDAYALDINNDQTVDYVISSRLDYYYGGRWIQISSPNGFNSSIVSSPFNLYPVPLNSGALIGHIPSSSNGETYSSLGVFSVGNCSSGSSGCYYDWQYLQDRYLGLRFFMNGHIHFGWVRMDVTSVSQWTIKDFAYQATPNTPIMAGQMVLGLVEVDLNKVKVKVANQTITIFNLPNRTEYKLYTMNGQVIGHGDLLQNSDSIDVQNLKTGLYILELRDNKSHSTLKRKILIP